MNTKTTEEIKISVQIKLASLWASFMFLYIYVDYFHLFMPGKLADIQSGKVFVYNVNQGFLLIALISVSIPAIMVFLSVAMPPKINRWVNIAIATLYIPFTLYNLVGEAWIHMVYGAIVELILLILVIHFSWKGDFGIRD